MAAASQLQSATAAPPPTGFSPRAVKGLVATVVLVSLLAVILLIASVLGLVGATVRWFLLLVVLVMASWWVVAWVSRRSFPMATMHWAPASHGARMWQVEDLVTLIERARRGMTYSQLLLAQRVRDLLLEKARVSRALDYETINRLRRDPARLLEFMGDPELTRFILEVDNGPNLMVARNIPPGNILRLRGDDFLVTIERIMDRVEAWH